MDISPKNKSCVNYMAFFGELSIQHQHCFPKALLANYGHKFHHYQHSVSPETIVQTKIHKRMWLEQVISTSTCY